MDNYLILGLGISIALNIVVLYRQRNMVTSKREGKNVQLKDRTGIIKPNIITE